MVVDGSVVVIGSWDIIVMVWDIEYMIVSIRRLGSIKDILMEKYWKFDIVVIFDKLWYVLCGYDDVIIFVVVRVELDIVVSGLKDFICIFYMLWIGRYVRFIRYFNRCFVINFKVL